MVERQKEHTSWLPFFSHAIRTLVVVVHAGWLMADENAAGHSRVPNLAAKVQSILAAADDNAPPALLPAPVPPSIGALATNKCATSFGDGASMVPCVCLTMLRSISMQLKPAKCSHLHRHSNQLSHQRRSSITLSTS